MPGLMIKFVRSSRGPGSMGMAEILISNLTEGASDVMQAVAETIKEFVDSRWDLQQDPWGKAWAPLNPAYLKWRIKKAQGVASGQRLPARAVGDGGVTILLYRGDLRRGWIPQWDRFSAWIANSGPSSKYARMHQFGGVTKTGAKIPARPMAPLRLVGGRVVSDLPQELKEEIAALMSEAVAQGLVEGTR